jgi:hypothetical protein
MEEAPIPIVDELQNRVGLESKKEKFLHLHAIAIIFAGCETNLVTVLFAGIYGGI